MDDLFTVVCDETYMSQFTLDLSEIQFSQLVSKGLIPSSYSRYGFLLIGGRDSLYHKIFQRIKDSQKETIEIVNASYFLSYLLKVYHKLDIIEGYEVK